MERYSRTVDKQLESSVYASRREATDEAQVVSNVILND